MTDTNTVHGRAELPYDVTINHITFRKGVSLQTFIAAARRWHSAAALHPTPQTDTDAREKVVEALERIATVDMGGGFLGAQACRKVAAEALAALKTGDA